jgi:TusA-related sulfurtransferase
MTVKPDKSINIKGLVCPMTFVRAKLAIESIGAGEVLEVILDYEGASGNVPRSMEEQGHEPLLVEKINDTDWRLLIRKGSA